MSIAEKKAKEIAKKLEASQAYKFDNFSVICGAIEGYNQAVKDFMEKAKKLLYLQLNNGSIECGNIERLIDDFKNYMQDESEN